MALEFIQLDKNTGDKRLRDACQLEGIVGCELVPRSVRDETDDVVLEYIIREQFVTFTFDSGLCVSDLERDSATNMVVKAVAGRLVR